MGSFRKSLPYSVPEDFAEVTSRSNNWPECSDWGLVLCVCVVTIPSGEGLFGLAILTGAASQ